MSELDGIGNNYSVPSLQATPKASEVEAKDKLKEAESLEEATKELKKEEEELLKEAEEKKKKAEEAQLLEQYYRAAAAALRAYAQKLEQNNKVVNDTDKEITPLEPINPTIKDKVEAKIVIPKGLTAAQIIEIAKKLERQAEVYGKEQENLRDQVDRILEKIKGIQDKLTQITELQKDIKNDNRLDVRMMKAAAYSMLARLKADKEVEKLDQQLKAGVALSQQKEAGENAMRFK
ncbi:MAG: hypothetical protein HYY52_07730 [Candidatus Melainabacteria bacterium]|nr:hypothetical protein [Candidatus Melainabacteria bacterium]